MKKQERENKENELSLTVVDVNRKIEIKCISMQILKSVNIRRMHVYT